MEKSAGTTHLLNQEINALAEEATISVTGRVAGRGLLLLGQILLARLLGPTLFGLYATGWTLFRILSVVATSGLNQGVIRYGSMYWQAEPERFKGTLVQAIGTTMTTGFILGSGLYLSATWLATDIFSKPDLAVVLRGFSVAIPLAACLAVVAAATTISKKMRYSVFSESLATPAVNLLLIVFFFIIGWQLIGAIAAVILSLAAGLFLAVIYLFRLFRDFLAQAAGSHFPGRPLMTFSLPIALSSLLLVLIFWVDRLFVTVFLPAHDVGLYQAASQTSLIFATILAGMNALIAPVAATLLARNKLTLLEASYRVVTKWGLYFSLPVFLVLCFAGDDLVTIVYGDTYQAATTPMLILATGQLVNIATGGSNILLIMAGYQNRWLALSITIFIVCVILNMVLIPWLGITGAAIATATAVSALFVFSLGQVKHHLHIWPYDRRYRKGFLAAIASVAALIIVQLFNINLPVVNLILTAVVAFGIFIFALWQQGLDQEDYLFLKNQLQKYQR